MHLQQSQPPDTHREIDYDDDEIDAINEGLTLLKSLSKRSVRRHDPLASNALYQLAKMKFDTLDFDGSYATLVKSMELDSTLIGQWLLLVEIYLETNKLAEARETLQVSDQYIDQISGDGMDSTPINPDDRNFYKFTWARQLARIKEQIQP